MSIINYKKCGSCGELFFAYDRQETCKKCECGVIDSMSNSKSDGRSLNLFTHAKKYFTKKLDKLKNVWYNIR